MAPLMLMAADWRIGDQHYRNVTVKQVTETAVIIQHSGGISQVPLEDLPPEAQKHFGYDPEAASAAKARLEKENLQALEKRKQQLANQQQSKARQSGPGVEAQQTVVKFHPEVDLRPHMRELGLTTKSQGRRPSCSVFAVVGALEYLSAKTGKPMRYSEDYAIWATREYLADQNMGLNQSFSEGDAGFRLIDVIDALEEYGLVDRESMPNTFGTGMDRIERPSQELLSTAKQGLVSINARRLDDADPEKTILRLTQCLNSAYPVVIGVPWPHENTLIAAPMISGQNPVSNHAVTLVGYRSDPNGENQRFLFKNSWGHDWGSGGYGWITADYLRKHPPMAYFMNPKFD